VTDDEEEIQNPKATSSKPPMGRRRTRSMVIKEKEFEEKDKIFTTYERKSRKRQQVQRGQIQESDDEAQQAQYAHIQTLEAQSLENDGFEEQETSTYEHMREYVEQLIKYMKEETQIEEVVGGSTSELDRKNKKIKKMKRKIKEIEVLERYIKTKNEMLRTQIHKTQEENETLKKKNKKLQKKNKLISKQAYKWFQQKKAYKEKYQRMKALHIAQVNVETLLQVSEVAEDH
jgi:DNA repair exonuclease SbcCD ATPase subunit